jgi:hypothetical protein
MFTKPWSSNEREDTHTDTQTDRRDLRNTPLRWAQTSRYKYTKYHDTQTLIKRTHRHGDRMEITTAYFLAYFNYVEKM